MRVMKFLNCLVPCLFVLLASSPVAAATWRVERDGTGEFTVIQDAVDVAAPGDVILIGPGRYDEYQLFEGNPRFPIFVLVEKDLTFVGTGIGETLIGPEDVFQFDADELAVGIWARGEAIQISISDLTVENLRENGIRLDRGRLDLERCEMRGCIGAGVFGLFSQGGWIRECSFHDNGMWGYMQGDGLICYEPSVDVLVENCTFIDNCGAGAGAWWGGCRDITIRDCHFEHGIVGVGFFDGASGSVINCTIENFGNYGIALSLGGEILIEDCTITQLGEFAGAGVGALYQMDSLTMRRNVVVSDTWVMMNFNARIDGGEIRDNHFLREGDDAWWVFTSTYYPLPEPRIINLEHNYWGTTDTALLDEWIYDGNDDENVDIFIDYLPLADGPVQTEGMTWGAVKALFR